MASACDNLTADAVPVEFCQQFCCAYRGGRCLQFSRPDGECLWTGEHVLRFVSSRIDQRQPVPGPVYAWAEKLRRKP